MELFRKRTNFSNFMETFIFPKGFTFDQNSVLSTDGVVSSSSLLQFQKSGQYIHCFGPNITVTWSQKKAFQMERFGWIAQ